MNKPFKAFLFFFIILIFLIQSCSYQHDKKAHESLIKSLIQVNEKINSDINFLQKSINRNKNRNSFLMQDPVSKEIAMEVEPTFHFIKRLTNKLDDFLLVKMNELIEKEENESDWFTADIHQRKVFYKEFTRLNHKDATLWTTILYGAKTKEATKNSELIKSSMIEYRNNLILAFAEEIKNYNDESLYITNGDLVSYEYFKTHLEEKRHPWKYKLLSIYSKLSIPSKINDSGVEKRWNEYTFNNQSLIGAISIFNFLRKDIKEAQDIAGKILVNEVMFSYPRF